MSTTVWAVGDAGIVNSDTLEVAARIPTNATHFIYLGDVYPDGFPEDYVNGYDPVFGGTAAHDFRNVTYPIPGNHGWPRHNTPGAYVDYWDSWMAAKGLPDEPLEIARYSFEVEGWRIIIINTEENPEEPDGIGGEVAEQWLDAELEAANGRALVCGHRPRYSPGDPNQDRGDGADLDVLWDLIAGRAVGYLAGHIHLCAVLSDDVNGLKQVIAGAGGEGLVIAPDVSELGPADFLNNTDTALLRMDFTPERIAFAFVKASNGATLYSFSLDAPVSSAPLGVSVSTGDGWSPVSTELSVGDGWVDVSVVS